MKSFFAFVLICVFLLACAKKPVVNPPSPPPPQNDCVGPAKSFAADVNPIVQSSCATSVSCHGAGSNSGPGPLLTYQQVFNARASIRSEVAAGRMPIGGSLSATQKSAIICWINNGALNNWMQNVWGIVIKEQLVEQPGPDSSGLVSLRGDAA